ncbi:aminotransferase class I/II-fold pyridoxal phosphate-dependent enzyme [Salinithrix halophila]|uniref:Aminotransferase class I/II-fold pyridoxal phosphate-dependent enzyme n=1 Tax=Salinithrix halophila TaxID=1485204 RepID=A0ABV8JB15_9BACL
MMKIPFLRPSLVRKEKWAYYLTQIDESRIYSNYGPLNNRFERRVLQQHFGGQGAVTTVNNATTGLMLAISQSRRRGGKYALMPSFTFPATPLAAIWCGLIPYFVDIRPDDWCMDEELLEQVLKKLGDQVAVVVPYAVFGTDLKLDTYRQLHRNGIPVVVDAASSFGTTGEKGQFGCGFPGMVVFSFHATKSFGIGEGGLVYSGNPSLVDEVRQAGNFGFSPDREVTMQGLNSKMSEYVAAIALATLDAFPKKRSTIERVVQWYKEQFQQHHLFHQGWRYQETKGRVTPQFLSVLCPADQSNQEIVNQLHGRGIEARTYFSPSCHQHRQFQSCPRTALSVTHHIAGRILSLPLWEELTVEHIRFIVGGVSTNDRRHHLGVRGARERGLSDL